jgi:hypothetical protein
VLEKTILWRQLARLVELPPFKIVVYPHQTRAIGGNAAYCCLDHLRLMFGYPVPTPQSPQFSNEAACLIHLGALDEQVVKAFQLVCSRDHV